MWRLNWRELALAVTPYLRGYWNTVGENKAWGAGNRKYNNEKTVIKYRINKNIKYGR